MIEQILKRLGRVEKNIKCSNCGMSDVELREVNSQSPVRYYDLTPNFISQNTDVVTREGALSTATVTAVGGNDRVAITGGDYTSRIKFGALRSSDSNINIRMRIRVDTAGTNSLLGIVLSGFNETSDTGSPLQSGLYFNLTTKAPVLIYQSVNLYNLTSYEASSGTLAASGDVLDIELTRDTIRGIYRLTIINTVSGQFATVLFTNPVSGLITMYDLSIKTYVPNIILTEGTYTVLSFSIDSIYPKNPAIHLMGDSMACGFSETYDNTLAHILSTKMGYNVANSSSNGSYINSMFKVQLQDVLKYRPKSVLLMTYLSIFYGDFKVSDPDNASYMQSLNTIMETIINLGARPILPKIDNWAVYGNGNESAWNTFVDERVAAYPSTLVLDLRGETATYDSSGYHYSGSFNKFIANALVKLLKSNNVI